MAWIQGKATEHGFVSTNTIDPPSDTILAKHGDSFTEFALGLYGLIKFNHRHLRDIGRPSRRTKRRPGWSCVINKSIDASVFEKWRKDESDRPRNLVERAEKTGESPGDAS